MTETVDCLVVGGGPAGLVAATYLARFRRRAVLVDAGRSRARWIPSSRNVPGFPEGVSGCDLLGLLRRQAEVNGAELRSGEVRLLRRESEGFRATGDGLDVAARSVILATGVVDRMPAIPDLDEAVRSGRIRLCPICDGLEASGLDVGVAGDGAHALAEARFLATYTDRLTLLRTGEGAFQPHVVEEARDAGVRVAPDRIAELRSTGEGAAALAADGRVLPFDAIYVALGASAQNGLATGLGAACEPGGCLVTDERRRTSVPDLYAVGDVAGEINQVSVAAGHAAIAATAVHNRLRERVSAP